VPWRVEILNETVAAEIAAAPLACRYSVARFLSGDLASIGQR